MNCFSIKLIVMGKEFGETLRKWFGQDAEDSIKDAADAINKKVLDKIPEGDTLLSLTKKLVDSRSSI